jgi:hypothetical protein
VHEVLTDEELESAIKFYEAPAGNGLLTPVSGRLPRDRQDIQEIGGEVEVPYVKGLSLYEMLLKIHLVTIEKGNWSCLKQ